jgi:hypothetical protein
MARIAKNVQQEVIACDALPFCSLKSIATRALPPPRLSCSQTLLIRGVVLADACRRHA